MIISEEKKLIFIHIPRTGGTSIRQLFDFPLLGFQTKAADLKAKLGDRWGEYFKFGIVRNPWDRLVSQYMFLREDPIGSKYQFPGGLAENETFREWIHRRLGHIPFSGDFYSREWFGDSEGNSLLNFVVYFENYEADVRHVLSQFNMNPEELPHLNKSNRSHYRDYYDEETAEIVRQNFSKDIERFGYSY